MFPTIRHRRLRENPIIRKMVKETSLNVSDLVYPVFVTHGNNIKKPITSMPGIYQFSIDMLLMELKDVIDLGIPGIIIFGIPLEKDAIGSEGYAKDGIVQQAVSKIKKAYPKLLIITDVCLCEFTDHGHCGIIKDEIIDNDATIELLAKVALSHCQAGADAVAPSDMMDGRVGKIRTTLDSYGFISTPIISYSVKYASAFYGPFREAAESTPRFGDRRSHQMDCANVREAIREAKEDIAEGADIVMVKPALGYLDVIKTLKDKFDCPVAAYNVSGEYSMVKAASKLGWIDEKAIVLEMLLGIKRAGADIILTYFAKDAATWLKEI